MLTEHSFSLKFYGRTADIGYSVSSYWLENQTAVREYRGGAAD
jgi:hypothetical protein